MSISGAGGSTISPETEKVNGFSSVSLLPILTSPEKLPILAPDKVIVKVSVAPAAMVEIELLILKLASSTVILEIVKSKVPTFSMENVCVMSEPWISVPKSTIPT